MPEATFTLATALFFQHSIFGEILIIAILGIRFDLSTSKIPILGKSILLEKLMKFSLSEVPSIHAFFLEAQTGSTRAQEPFQTKIGVPNFS